MSIDSFKGMLEYEAMQDLSVESHDWLQCQAIIRHLVSDLVNGKSLLSRKRPSTWVYRYISAVPAWWRQEIRWSSAGPYSRRLARHIDGVVSARAVYAALREAEDFLSDPPSEIPLYDSTRQVDKYSASAHANSIVSTMQRELEALTPCASVYLHGSMASQDHTAMSDVDDLVVVHSESWRTYRTFRETVRILERCARRFQILDPLQHHGHWVFTDFDLACLDESVMPLVVLDKALVIRGSPVIRARVWRSTFGFRDVLRDIIGQIVSDTEALLDNRLTIFRLKALISAISLVPALVSQLSDRMVDKKTAIHESHRWFSDEAIVAIEWATAVRELWESCPDYERVRGVASYLQWLPFRRPALEHLSAKWSPVMRADDIPAYKNSMPMAIFQLAHECNDRLDKGRCVA